MDQEGRDEPEAGVGQRSDGDDEKPPVDLSIELEDASGRTARVVLGVYGAIRRPLETYVLRRGDQEAQRFTDHWELILQTYSIPFADFVAENASLDLRQLTTIRFVFDRVHAGEVVVDHIGISELEPGFLSARVER